MGQFYVGGDEFPLADQIKSLGDDELLDFWEETQFLDRFLEEELSASSSDPLNGPAPMFMPEPFIQTMEYERLILQELQLRASRRLVVDQRQSRSRSRMASSDRPMQK